MDTDLLIGIGALLLITYGVYRFIKWSIRQFFPKKEDPKAAPLYEYKGQHYTRPLTEEEKSVIDADISHKRKSPKEREIAMMQELDEIKSKKEAKEWLDYMGIHYDYGELPPKVYARVMCIIEGKEWLSDEEYERRNALN